MRLLLRSVVAAALAAGFASAGAAPSAFDGAWNVTLTCPPHNAEDDDAKGYTHRFPATVEGGMLHGSHGSHGSDGEPGWHDMHGRIGADGDASLRLDGIVSNPKYAINGAQRGKPYSYRVKAHFDERNGTGQRHSGRACEFKFTR